MSTRLLTLICLLSASVCTTSAQDPPSQGLDLAAGILEQLQQPNAATAVRSLTAPASQSAANPFADLRNPPLVDQPSTSGTGVAVTKGTIEVEINGRRIVVPRTKNPNWVPVAPAGPIPANASASTTEAFRIAQLYQQFSAAITEFHSGNPQAAVRRLKPLEPQFRSDPIITQAYALFQFQSGNVDAAAEWLYHALRLKGRLFVWSDIQQFYPEPTRYAQQYAALQRAASQQPDNSSVAFLTACHHLSLGHHDHARAVLARLPGRLQQDAVVQSLVRQATPGSAVPQPLAQ